MGSVAYNAHMSDLVLVLADICDAFNYTDDNTACRYGTTIQEVSNKLNNVVTTMLTWFNLREMKLNRNKFQLIVFDKQSTEHSFFNVGESVIENWPVVKLLGLNLDSRLVLMFI